MAKLLKQKAIAARIRAGNDLTAKAEIAESTGGYEDWLFLSAKWREETATELTTRFLRWRSIASETKRLTPRMGILAIQYDAYEYLRLSILALHLLEGARSRFS
jgi:hypothetical protein